MDNSQVKDQRRAKKRFWQTQIRIWKKSGLSQNGYYSRNTLRASQFCYWKKKLSSDNQDTIKFVPIAVERAKDIEQHDAGDSGLTISLGQISIKLTNDFSPSVLAKAVAALGGKL